MIGNINWVDAAIFIGVFVCIRIVVIWMATQAFLVIIPDGDVCPLCDAYTLPIERNGWWRLLGQRYRRSWCLGCGWEGVLRRSAVPYLLDPNVRLRPRRRRGIRIR